MRNTIPIAAAVAAISMVLASGPVRADHIDVYYQGRRVDLGGFEPYRNRGVWVIPASGLLREARIRFDYNDSNKELVIHSRDEAFRINMGSDVAYGSGRKSYPLRAVAASFGREPHVPYDLLELVTRTRSTYDDRRQALYFGDRDRDPEPGRPSREIDIRVDGRPVELSRRHQPFQIGRTWMVPAVQVLLARGISARLESRKNELLAFTFRKNYSMAIGNSLLMRDGLPLKRLEERAEIRGGEVFVPLSFVEIVLEGSSRYDERRNSIEIVSAVRTPDRPVPDRLANPIRIVRLDGRDVRLDSQFGPIEERKLWELPIESMLSGTSARFSLDSSRREIIIRNGERTARIKINSNQLSMDPGGVITLDSWVREVGPVIYAPLRLFEIVLDRKATIDYNRGEIRFER